MLRFGFEFSNVSCLWLFDEDEQACGGYCSLICEVEGDHVGGSDDYQLSRWSDDRMVVMMITRVLDGQKLKMMIDHFQLPGFYIIFIRLSCHI